MKILFMGTPDFALYPLSALISSGENVIGVITQPDKPKGRKYKLTPPPVKVYAEKLKIPVYQPTSLRRECSADLLAQLDPELVVVAAYGKILPQYFLDYPKYGCICVHASLLPEYRGASPIQRAIIDGKTKTGVTIMQMDAGIDTGDILLKRSIPIGKDDNFKDVHDRLSECGGAALEETLALLKSGNLTPTPQGNSLATYAAKIEKCDCKIDFSAPADRVHNLIRGLSPIPLAFTRLPDCCLLKVPAAEPLCDAKTNGAAPGTVISLDCGIIVACGSGAVRLTCVLPECKCRMSAEDFIRGRKICVGDILS